MQQLNYRLKNKVTGIREVERRSGHSQGKNSQSPTTLIERINFLERELQKSQEEAFRAGFEEGKERGLMEAQSKVEEFQSLINFFEKQYLEELEKIRAPLLKLAKKMAEKVIGAELKNDTEADSILMERLKKILNEIVDQTRVIVEINPKHLPYVNNEVANRELNLPARMEINVVGESGLKPGECRIKTESYFINGTFADQLDHLEEQLLTEDAEWNH